MCESYISHDTGIKNYNKQIKTKLISIICKMQSPQRLLISRKKHSLQIFNIYSIATKRPYFCIIVLILIHKIIESCRWNDITYNFLIGGDGNVYEGRGWGVVGAHACGYNARAVGISFVGCFMKELPPAESLAACKLLIKRGVELGHIDPNYKLLSHCQCSPTESPGRRLFEEIKTWPHFTEQNQVT